VLDHALLGLLQRQNDVEESQEREKTGRVEGCQGGRVVSKRNQFQKDGKKKRRYN
jgi:hypothetical protein